MRQPHDSQPVEQVTQFTERRLEARVGPRNVFNFRVTPEGNPNGFRPTELRLLDVLAPNPPNSLLVPDANDGVLGTVMGAMCEQVWMTEPSARHARRCRRNAVRNGVSESVSVAIASDPRQLSTSAKACAYAPTEYVPCVVVQQRLADSLRVLAPGGSIYLAARAGAGLRRYSNTLTELCDGVTVAEEHDEITVLRGRRPETVNAPRYLEPIRLSPTIDGTTLTLVSSPGLFSAKALDDGTRALAESIDIQNGEQVLDLACGYGPLGVFAAKTTDCKVTLTDDHRVASVCARRSATKSGVPDVTVRTADAVRGLPDGTFDRVLCNPPTHVGSAILHDLMRGASDVLTSTGQLDVVHHQGIPFEQFVTPYLDRLDTLPRGEYQLLRATSP